MKRCAGIRNDGACRSAEAFGEMMRQESTRWASVIKESGFKLD